MLKSTKINPTELEVNTLKRVREQIKDDLADGDNFDSLVNNSLVNNKVSNEYVTPYNSKAMKLASQEYQKAMNMALEIKDQDLIKQSAEKAVEEQIKIGGKILKERAMEYKERAMEELQTAFNIAKKSEDTCLIAKSLMEIEKLKRVKCICIAGC